jgi:hypothetical protein
MPSPFLCCTCLLRGRLLALQPVKCIEVPQNCFGALLIYDDPKQIFSFEFPFSIQTVGTHKHGLDIIKDTHNIIQLYSHILNPILFDFIP